MTSLFVFCSVSAAAGAAAFLFKGVLDGSWKRVDRRISEFQRAGRTDPAGKSKMFRDLSVVESGRNRLRQQFGRWMEQSDLSFSPGQILGASVLSGIMLMLPLAAWRARSVFLAVAFLIGALAPVLYIAFRRRRRIDRLRRQLPDAFDSMGRALQAGQSVPAALQLVANEGRQPLAREFARACEQHNLGLSFEQTLQDLSARVPVIELRILAIALIVQRQAGGNPMEIISNMAELSRKRISFAAKIRALTGEGRMQAIVLTLLPIGAFVGLWVGRPEYIQCLLDRPRLLQALVAAQVVAAVWIRKVVRFDF